MSNLDTINVGGIDFEIEDSTARSDSAVVAYKENGDTASQAYSVIGVPINWKGTLCYTSTVIAAGDILAIGTNLTSAINIGRMLSNIKTYVGADEKLHFTDATGADSVLPFSGAEYPGYAYSECTQVSTSSSYTVATDGIYIIIGGGTGAAYNRGPGYASTTIKVNNVNVSAFGFSTAYNRDGANATSSASFAVCSLVAGDVISISVSATGYTSGFAYRVYKWNEP